MKNNIDISFNVFDDIKHVDEYGRDFWLARELMPVLEYNEWRKFMGVIDKSIINCDNSKYKIIDHFVGADKLVSIGSKCTRKIKDFKLSRYACYLIVLNCDPRKKVISLAKTYFAVQTRKQEILEMDYEKLTEDEKRFYQRKLTKKFNYKLGKTVFKRGVKNFDNFQNYGYRGLYNGESAADIAKRKGLGYREDILDNMCPEELAANLFRITQTDATIIRNDIKGEKDCCDTHYNIGVEIRNTIKRIGGTMPEELPTPEKSLKQLNKEKAFEKYEK